MSLTHRKELLIRKNNCKFQETLFTKLLLLGLTKNDLISLEESDLIYKKLDYNNLIKTRMSYDFNQESIFVIRKKLKILDNRTVYLFIDDYWRFCGAIKLNINDERLRIILDPLIFFNDDLCFISDTTRILIDFSECNNKFEIDLFMQE